MKVMKLTVGSYQTNCYGAWADDSEKCVLIDPGYQPEEILDAVRSQGKTVEAILLTHGHFDHVGGVKHIAQETGCRVYICKEDLDLNPAITAGAIYYTDTYRQGDITEAAGLSFRVLQTPGHTPGSVCLLCEDVMFAGDTLFAGTCGRTDLPGGSSWELRQSLEKLSKLGEDYHVLPGHGPGSTLAEEKRSNPFMQGL